MPRKFSSFLVCLALVFTAPGLAPYRALAEVVVLQTGAAAGLPGPAGGALGTNAGTGPGVSSIEARGTTLESAFLDPSAPLLENSAIQAQEASKHEPSGARVSGSPQVSWTPSGSRGTSSPEAGAESGSEGPAGEEVRAVLRAKHVLSGLKSLFRAASLQDFQAASDRVYINADRPQTDPPSETSPPSGTSPEDRPVPKTFSGPRTAVPRDVSGAERSEPALGNVSRGQLSRETLAGRGHRADLGPQETATPETPPTPPPPARGFRSALGAAGKAALAPFRGAVSVVRAVRLMLRGDDEVRPFVRKYNREFRTAQGLLILDAALNTVIGFGMGAIIDAAMVGHQVPGALVPLVLYSSLVFISNVAYILTERFHAWLSGRLGVKVTRDFRIHFFGGLLRLSMGFFKENKSQELSPRLSEDVNQLKTKNVSVPVGVPHYLMQLLFSAGMLFYVNWAVALGVIAAMPLFGILASKFGNRFETLNEEYMDRRVKMIGRAGESMSHMEVIKVFGSESAELDRFTRSANELYGTGEKLVYVESWYHALMSSLTDFATKLFIIFVGSWMYFYLGYPSIGTITAMQAYAFGVKYATQGLSNEWTNYKKAEGAAKRVLGLLALQPTVADRPGAEELGPIQGRVEFQNVRFSYDGGRTPVLEELDFTVEPGQVVAFVGGTGSGKTSILRLIARLYDPVEGSVRIDERDLKDVQRKSLVRQLAVVPQDSALFSGTVRENLLAVEPGASEEAMRAALQAARADFVFDPAVCPNGLDTDVGEGGAKLSGGQRQRIAIARAILRNPKILLLDEATSNLDNESERLVQEALKELMKGRTTFVVAHRLTTIQGADKIFVVEKGRIVESGTHKELMSKKGSYYKLWRASSQQKEKEREKDEKTAQ